MDDMIEIDSFITITVHHGWHTFELKALLSSGMELTGGLGREELNRVPARVLQIL